MSALLEAASSVKLSSVNITRCLLSAVVYVRRKASANPNASVPSKAKL